VDTKERPYTSAIRTLKEKIKALAVLQKKTKLARKTVHIDPELRKKLLAELGTEYPAGAAISRKTEITAHLNLYLELRGKAYRHNAPPKDSYELRAYENELSKLRKELKIE
jgi:hypothetical protein